MGGDILALSYRFGSWPERDEWRDCKDLGGKVWRLLFFTGLVERSIGEKSRSVLLDCCTNGLVGAFNIKFDEYDEKDGPLDLSDIDSVRMGCAGGNRGSAWKGLYAPGVHQGVFGVVPKGPSSASLLENRSDCEDW